MYTCNDLILNGFMIILQVNKKLIYMTVHLKYPLSTLSFYWWILRLTKIVRSDILLPNGLLKDAIDTVN